MMATQPEVFDYKSSPFCPGNDERASKWLNALERTSPRNVRIILEKLPHGAGSAGSITVGTQQSVTIGFVQEWLAWKDRVAANETTAARDRELADQKASTARAVEAAERAAAAAETQAEQAQRANRISAAALIVALLAALMSLIALTKKIS
jgi:hypothetical protein